MAVNLATVQARLWAGADQPRANTGLRPADFSEAVLGLPFTACSGCSAMTFLDASQYANSTAAPRIEMREYHCGSWRRMP
jgi:hypothetical protein